MPPPAAAAPYFIAAPGVNGDGIFSVFVMMMCSRTIAATGAIPTQIIDHADVPLAWVPAMTSVAVMIATMERISVAPNTKTAIPRYCLAIFPTVFSDPGRMPRINAKIANTPSTSMKSFAMKIAPPRRANTTTPTNADTQ